MAWLLASACATLPTDQPAPDLRPADQKFAVPFSTRDPLSLSAAFIQFERAVAPAERPAVLERMWDAGVQARDGLRVGVLRYLAISARREATCWSKGLATRLDLAATDPDETVRRGVLAVLFERFDPKLRGVILRFLDDPNDEIRAVALRQLAAEKWPEAVQVLQSYLQANGADPERAGSTQEARAGLRFLSQAPAQVVAPFGPPVAPLAPPPPVQPVPEPKPTRGTRLGDD